MTPAAQTDDVQGRKGINENMKTSLDAKTSPEKAGNKTSSESFSTEKRHGIDQTQLDRDPAFEHKTQIGTTTNQSDQDSIEHGTIGSQSSKPHSEYGSVSTKVGDPDPETYTQRPSDRLHHAPNIDTFKSEKSNKDTCDKKTSDNLERPPATGQPRSDVPGTEAHTVGISTTTQITC